MRLVHPDLTMIETKFAAHIGQHNIQDVEIYMFPQDWANTGGGLAEPGYCYGQMFIQQYTTVILSRKHHIAMVWFDNVLGYIVTDIRDRFWNDLKNMRMKDRGHSHYYNII